MSEPRRPSQRLAEKMQEDAASKMQEEAASAATGTTARRPSQRLLAKLQRDSASRASSTRASMDSGHGDDDHPTNQVVVNREDAMTDMPSKVEAISPSNKQEPQPVALGIGNEEKQGKQLPPKNTEHAEITTKPGAVAVEGTSTSTPRPGAVAVDGVNSREGNASAEAGSHGQFSFTAPPSISNEDAATGTAGDQTLISAVLVVDDDDGSKDNDVQAEIPVYEATRVSIHEDEGASRKRRKYCLAGTALLMAIVIGVVLSVVFAGGRSNIDDAVGTSASETVRVVTGAPSTSAPTNVPTTSAPTITPTFQPTQLEWKQLGRDVGGIARYDDMGHTLAMSDDGTVVAAGTGSGGYVRIFRLRQDPAIKQDDGYFWELMGEIRTGSDSFGMSVALSANGTTIAVGDPWLTDDLGGLHVFQYDAECVEECWMETHVIEFGDEGGSTVSISEDGTIVAGGTYYGQMVGVYQLGEEREWEEIGLIKGTGMSVSISGNGNRVVSGHGLHDDSLYGVTTVYGRTRDGGYTQIGQGIEGEGENKQGFSGQSVWMSRDGKRIAVGDSQNSPGNNTGIEWTDDDPNYGAFGLWRAGHIRVFEYDEESGTLNQVGHDIDGREAWEGFGFPLAMSGDGNVVIGRSSTSVRAFRLVDNEWMQHGPDIPNFDGEFDDEDRSIAISRDGTVVAVGHVSERAALGAGSVRVYRLT